MLGINLSLITIILSVGIVVITLNVYITSIAILFQSNQKCDSTKLTPLKVTNALILNKISDLVRSKKCAIKIANKTGNRFFLSKFHVK